jgi:hypothetical protein
LGESWHADHVEPWKVTHRTNLFEMQALCARCNLKKGSSTVPMSLRQDKYDPRPYPFDVSRARIGQRAALATTIRRFRTGCSYTAIEMATRYGKSDLMRMVTLAAVDAGDVAVGLCLVVTDYLRFQMDNDRKWNEMMARYDVTWPGPVRHRIIDGIVQNPIANGELFLTTTVQFFQWNLNYWIQWANSVRARTGKPIVLHVDECQMQSVENTWGAAVMEFQKQTGAFIVLYTATPDRADGVQIPGFEYEQVEVKPIKITKVREGSEPHLIAVDLYEGTRQMLRLKAHHRTTCGDAWKETPLPLCRIESPFFDVDLSKVLDGDVENAERGMLSDLTDEASVRRVLGPVVRHALVIETGAELLLRYLDRYRSANPSCGGIVFCGNDTPARPESDAEINRHANEIRKVLLRLNRFEHRHRHLRGCGQRQQRQGPGRAVRGGDGQHPDLQADGLSRG